MSNEDSISFFRGVVLRRVLMDGKSLTQFQACLYQPERILKARVIRYTWEKRRKNLMTPKLSVEG